MKAIAVGKNSTEIEEIIKAFFDERIQAFDKNAGDIAVKEGKTEKHKRVMEDLIGLHGKFDRSCAEAIFNNATVREFLQYRDSVEKGTMISPELVSKDNISQYKQLIEKVKRFSVESRPDVMLGNKILSQTNKGRNTRRILLDSVREQDQRIMDDYDKLVAYYLLLGGDKPIQAFSRIEMSMKSYGLRPDLGSAIMKWGDKLTSKLEELASQGKKSPQEWEVFRSQVLHSFAVAENIGNRNVNQQEHMIWEERLIKLGILERRLENPNEQKGEGLRESLRVDSKDKPSDTSKQGIALDSEMLARAQIAYENTGAIPLGYTLGKDGKVVSIASKVGIDINGTNKLAASKGNLSTTKKGQEQIMK